MTEGPVTYIEKGFALHQAVTASGNRLWEENGEWRADDAETVQGIIDSFDALASAKQGALARLATYRYGRETMGLTVDGVSVATDRQSQAMVDGAYTMARDGVATSFNFKSTTGFVSLTAQQMLDIGKAVGSHVQTCFSAESAIAAQINALTDWNAALGFDVASAWTTAGGP